MSILQFKRGDTVSITCTDSFGDLTGITVEASIKTSPSTRRSLTVNEVDMSAGQYELAATASESATWPIGRILCDIKYSAPGVVSRTNTFEIYISEAITL